jgi:MoaA/NifB/PqqE/SkfB family radical SAM enzyme
MLPTELYLEPTNRCNSRCQTCVRTFEAWEPPHDLALDEFCSLVDQMSGLRRAVLHGVGEPLLHPNLPAMVAYLKDRTSPPLVLFNSNALALTPGLQVELIEAGLDEFRVSIDAARPGSYARIRGVDAFDRVVENIATFSARIRSEGRGPRLSLWLTALRENLPELPDLVRLAWRLGVGEVYVQRLVFHGRGLARRKESLFRALHAAEAGYLAQAEALAAELGVALQASGATSPRDSLEAVDAERPWARCRRPHTLMYITANGNVLPCCFSPFTVHDYAGLILGNAFRSPLVKIWQGAAYRRFRAALQSQEPPEACDRCGVCWSL